MHRLSMFLRAFGLGLVCFSTSCTTFLAQNPQNAAQKEVAPSTTSTAPKRAKSKVASSKTENPPEDVKDVSTGDWRKDCRKGVKVSYPKGYVKDQETCRIGMTTDFLERKGNWEDDYACLGIQTKDWKWLAKGIPSKDDAQNCEDQLATEHGCFHWQGGEDPSSPIHLVYKLNCYRNGQPTACVANPRGICDDKKKEQESKRQKQ